PGKRPNSAGVLCPTRTHSARRSPAQGAEPRRQADEGRELPEPLALPPVAFQQLADPLPEPAALVGPEVDAPVHGLAFATDPVAQHPDDPAPGPLGEHGSLAQEARAVRLDHGKDLPPAGLRTPGVIRWSHVPLPVRSD